MKPFKIISLALIILSSCFACDKDSETPDLATMVEGVYVGYWTVYGRNFNGSCEVIYNSKTTLNFKMETEGGFDTIITEVKLSNGSNGEIEFLLTDSNGEFKGSIINNTLSFTIDDGKTTTHFSGSK